MACSAAMGFQTAKLVDVPLEVAGKSQPFVFFFQPSKAPVIATTKKKINKAAPIIRCTFLNILKTVTCIIQSYVNLKDLMILYYA
jgi:hypothetical protein